MYRVLSLDCPDVLVSSVLSKSGTVLANVIMTLPRFLGGIILSSRTRSYRANVLVAQSVLSYLLRFADTVGRRSMNLTVNKSWLLVISFAALGWEHLSVRTRNLSLTAKCLFGGCSGIVPPGRYWSDAEGVSVVAVDYNARNLARRVAIARPKRTMDDATPEDGN